MLDFVIILEIWMCPLNDFNLKTFSNTLLFISFMKRKIEQKMEYVIVVRLGIYLA